MSIARVYLSLTHPQCNQFKAIHDIIYGESLDYKIDDAKRIANDVLILILAHLDPPSLWRACQAFKRIYLLVMEYSPLHYTFELALTGMRDGPAPYSYRSPVGRLQLLLSYRKDWPKLNWIHECKQLIPDHARAGISAGFLHLICSHGGQYALDLVELPSMRTGRAPAQTRHLKFNTPEVENIVIDRAQSLVVTSHLIRTQNGVGVLLYFRDLWTFGKHPRAHGGLYDFSAGPTPVANMSMVICGYKMAVSFEFAGGKMKHLILNWRRFQAMWLEESDIYFLNENYILVFRRSHGHPLLALYNIADLGRVTVEREYELPDSWSRSTIGFSLNTSPMNDRSSWSEALFYSDPSNRVLLLTVKSSAEAGTHVHNWIIINESYFRSAPRRDHLRIPWAQWSQHCLIRDIAPSVQVPNVNGSRVVFLDSVHSSAGWTSSRLNIIDFAPFPEPGSCRPGQAWSWIGKRSSLIPNEVTREVPPKTVDGRQVEEIRVTEDNVVLFLEHRDGFRPVNILTFGSPPQTTRSRYDLYSSQL